MKHTINRTDFIELVEDQPHDVAGLLIGVEGHLTGRQFDVPAGDLGEQLATLGLVEPASIQSISHSYKLEFADRTLVTLFIMHQFDFQASLRLPCRPRPRPKPRLRAT